MSELPSGTVTFLFTDLEGSTRLWEQHPEAMQGALARHEAILRDAVAGHRGHVVKTTGDGFHVVFATARDALDAAVAAQLGLAAESFGETGPLRVRMGVHTCEAEQRDGDYYGSEVNRAARLMSVAHGGQIVLSGTTRELVADALASRTSLSDLGEHRLRDLAQPIRVFQVEHADLPSQFPPLRSLDAYPTNLAAQLSSFIGRETELAAISEAFENARLVTITGVGGVGKTRLALHAADNLLPEFSDGVWLCELAAGVDAESMVQIVATAIGTIARQGMTLGESTVEYLRDRVALVLLDNCEHLIDPAGRFAADVLRACSGVRILATSREGLGVEGERVLPLRSLHVPARVDVPSVRASSAGRLFVERASAVDPKFVLDNATASAVSEICRRLDGIPLAIELAAARVAAMSANEVAAHLDERFRLLTGGRRTAVERHHTLRATVDWSYSLLDAGDRIVFDRLGVFAGSFDAEAAIAVVADESMESWDVLDSLSVLVSKSMVDADRGADDTTRYSMLETLRQYARERLDEGGDVDSWRQRHAGHYVAFAEEAGRGITTPDEISWYRRITEELDNLRSAFIWSLDSPVDEGERATRIVAALALVPFRQRRLGIAEWAERARERAESTPPGRRSAILAAAALHALNAAQPETARALAESALRDGLPADLPSPSLPYITLVISEGLSGNAKRAVEIADGEARRALEAVGAAPLEYVPLAVVRALFGAVYGDSERAEAESTLAEARKVGQPSAIAEMLFIAAWVSWEDDLELACSRLEESVALAHAGASDATIGHSLALLAVILVRLGDSRAVSTLRESIMNARYISVSSLASVLDRGILVWHALEQAEVVGVSAGAITDGAFRDLSIVPHAELRHREAATSNARELLGDDDYDRAVARGIDMSADEVVRYVLAAADRVLGAPRDA